MSAQELADATERLGLPIGRSVLANLENGRRPTISVAELLVLAAALRVPPIELVFPVGHVEHVEIPFDLKTPAGLPPLVTLPVDTWSAVQWFTGEQVIRATNSDDGRNHLITGIKQSASPIALYREHDAINQEWWQSKDGARKARSAADAASDDEERDSALARADTLERKALDLERELTKVRQEMRRADISPPSLSRSLSHIDDEETT